MIKNDWAIVTLERSLPSAPIPVRVTPAAKLPEDTGNGDFNFGNSMNQLASVKANNIFMTKLTYYFGR